jgi:hypothetical protein
MAKILQTFFANQSRADEIPFKVREQVMLATLHCRQDFKSKGDDRSAKFFPRYDGPYTIINAHPETSSYTLLLPNLPAKFPTFHASLLKCHVPNDPTLFPSCELTCPAPILTNDGPEWTIEPIIDSRPRGRGMQYLVRWAGYGPSNNSWLPSRKLQDCEVLDVWFSGRGESQAVAFSHRVLMHPAERSC